MSAALQLSGVSKSFGGLKVIDDVSFDVRRGSRTALIGPNGAGKSTIFNLVSGVYPIDAGRIVAQGHDITHMSVAKRVAHGVARSFQNIRLMPHLSTIENVMLGEHHYSSPFALARGVKASENARAALADAGLGTYPGQVVADLPYGIQKRIEVVRAIMARPSILLLDEPAASLDIARQALVAAEIRRFAQAGGAAIVATHDLSFARNCDLVVVLAEGRLTAAGDPSTTLTPDVIAVTWGESAQAET